MLEEGKYDRLKAVIRSLFPSLIIISQFLALCAWPGLAMQKYTLTHFDIHMLQSRTARTLTHKHFTSL